MYKINEKGLKLLELYKNKTIAETIGVHVTTIGNIKRHNKTCNKQTAYGLTKFLNSSAEIEEYFYKEG